MNVLVLTLRYPPYVAGGYELQTRDAVEALRARGHAVTVLAGRGERLRGAPDTLAMLEPDLDGAQDPWARALVAGTAERARLHLFRTANYKATARALRATEPDVALFFNLGLVSTAPILALRHAGVPSVGYIGDAWPANHWIEQWRANANAARDKAGRLAALERAWRVVRELVELGPLLAVSAFLRASLIASGIEAETIDVLHASLPPDMEAAAARRPSAARPRRAGEPLTVVCASSLWEGKGQDVLVEALALARGAPGAMGAIELVLAGSERAEFRASLERRTRELGLAQHVRFLGALGREALSDVLARAHVLAVPSLWGEPFGLVTLEGMAHGLAVLASDAGASPEIVRDGVDGRVLRAGDASAWARGLCDLAADDALRVARGAAARAGAVERFPHARFVDELEHELGRHARRTAP